MSMSWDAILLEEVEHWYVTLNEDAMAVEKLSEGIRKFYADTHKLEQYVRETKLPRILAVEVAR